MPCLKELPAMLQSTPIQYLCALQSGENSVYAT